nr:Rgg/GadR/MutR family transcriptional regulator [Lactococcus sp. NH2-7C]
MMSFERIDLMLEEMQVPLAEYELIVNNYMPNFQEFFILELEKAEFSQNRDKIKELYSEVKETGNHLLTITVKTKLGTISQTEVKEIETYLCNIEEWGYFELTLFYFVSDFLNVKQLELLLFNFDKRCENYCRVLKYRRRLLQIAYKSVAIYAANGERTKAENILEMTKKYRTVGVDLYSEVLRHLARGIIIFNFENAEVGEEKINYALETLEEFGGMKIKEFYQKKMEKYLKRSI